MMRRSVLFVWFSLLVLVCSCAPHKAERASELLRRKKEASNLIFAGNFEQALPVLESLAIALKDDPEVLSMLGETLWKTGDFPAALSNFEASIHLDYANWRTHLLLALMLMEKGKTGRALTEFELGARYGAGKAVAHYNYGLALYEMGRRNKALDQWKKAFQLEGDNPNYAAAVGMALSDIDEHEALTYFEKAAALGGGSHLFHHNFGVLLERLDEMERAKQQFILALDKESDNEEYLLSLAGVYVHLKEYEKAIPLWKELVERSYYEKASRIYLAKCYLETGAYDEAIATLEEKVTWWQKEQETGTMNWENNKPGLDKAMEILALSYRELGQIDKGLKYMRESVKINPDNADYRVNYGAFLAESGMIDKARIQWKKALELDPDNEVARKNLQGIRKQP